MSPDDSYERFTRLLLEHEPEILQAVLAFVPNRADARDIVQETAVVLWKSFKGYDQNRSFANWAIGYARIQVRRFLRSGARRVALSERAMDVLDSLQDQGAAVREKKAQVLRRCLEDLPEAGRGIIADYYFREQSVEMLALNRGKSAAAIYKILQRLRVLLLECVTIHLREA